MCMFRSFIILRNDCNLFIYLIEQLIQKIEAENEDMVKRICEELPFETVDITDMLPAALKDNCSKRQKDPEDVSLLSQAENGYIQLLPGQYDTDGFFIAKLRRSR